MMKVVCTGAEVCRERRQRRKVKTRGWKQKHRLTRLLTSVYVYTAVRERAHPAPSAAIKLQFSTGTSEDGMSDVFHDAGMFVWRCMISAWLVPTVGL